MVVYFQAIIFEKTNFSALVGGGGEDGVIAKNREAKNTFI